MGKAARLSCSVIGTEKFRKIHRKTLLLQSLFNKFAGCRSFLFSEAANLGDQSRLRPATAKETLAQVFSCEFYDMFKNTFSDRTPLVAASVI